MSRAVLAFPLDGAFELTPEARVALSRFSTTVVADPASSVDALRGADVLVTGADVHGQTAPPMDFVRAMPALRWVHSVTAGLDPRLQAQLAGRDVVVTSSAGAYSAAIAQYAFAALVLLARRIPDLLCASQRHVWTDVDQLGGEVGGKLVGIIGYGGIGRHLADLCTAVGGRVWGLRRHPDAGDPGAAERVLGPEGLAELLREADMVVVAASLNPSSRGLIGERELGLLKPDSLLVSVSRGGIVDDDALRRALIDGRLGGAMLDVTETEPLPADHPLWAAPNLWITPHMSGRTRESRARVLALLVANLRAYAAGALGDMHNVMDVTRELEQRR